MRLFIITCLIVVTTALPEPLGAHNDYNSISPPSQNLYQPPLPPSSSLSSSGNDELETPHISKHVYYHTAPDEPEEETRQVLTSKPQKHYRIVFINAPVYKPAKLSLVNPVNNEDKTIIYVLSRKTDLTDLDIATPAPITEPSKPEVYFIKYKTKEEALTAQQQIQAHYDALGGETKHNDEEISPIQSVIGAFTTSQTVSEGSASSSVSGSHLPVSSNLAQHSTEYIPPVNGNHLINSPYLPPSKKY